MKVYELKRQLSAVKKDIKALVLRAEGEDRPMDDEETNKYQEMQSSIEMLTKRIDALESVEGDEGEDEAPRSAPKADVEYRNVAPAVHTKKHEYSMFRAIKGQVEGRFDGMEREVSQEIAHRTGNAAKGFYVPYGAFKRQSPEQRAFNLSAGAGGIPALVSTDYIELLRNRTRVIEAGARVITGLTGSSYSFPRQSAAATNYYVAESTAGTASNPTYNQVTLTPHTLTGNVTVSRKLILQMNADAEALAKDDLIKVIAVGTDSGALNGTGSSNQPTGLLQNSNVGIVALGSSGGVMTYAKLLEFEQDVATANADVPTMSWIVNAKGRAALKNTAKIGSTFPEYLWEKDNTMIGYKALVSQNVPSNLTKGSGTGLSGVVFGNFDDLLIGIWGDGVDLVVDPYSSSTTGDVKISIFQDYDVQPRHDGSFAVAVDASF